MRGRRWRDALLAVALLPFAAWAAWRLLGAENGSPQVQLMAFTPYVAAASVVPLVASLATRRWWHAGAAALLAVVLGACVLPRAVPGSGAAAGPGDRTGVPVRVLTANLYLGTADPGALVTRVRDARVDVLAVQELTPAAAGALDAAGLGTLLPYRAAYPAPGGGGSGVFSRYPLADAGVRLFPGDSFTQAHATLLVPGAVPVAVESAHPRSPVDARDVRRWRDDLALEPTAARTGPPRILLGDFNSTLDHGRLRTLVATGYRDAASTLGEGLTPTWPYREGSVDGIPIPKVTLDHVLADGRLGIRAVAVHPIAGSDHRAVYAELVLPPA